MRNGIVASVFGALLLVGCGVPDEGADVESEAEALTTYAGHCQVYKNLETGLCVAVVNGASKSSRTTPCVQGGAPVAPVSPITGFGYIDSRTCNIVQ